MHHLRPSYAPEYTVCALHLALKIRIIWRREKVRMTGLYYLIQDHGLQTSALTRGRADHFSNIFSRPCIFSLLLMKKEHLWPWTLNYHLGLRTWPRQSQVEPLFQISRSKVILFKSYRTHTHTHTHTHTADRVLYTATKAVGNKATSMW